MNKPSEPNVSGRGAGEWAAAGKRVDEKLALMWEDARKQGAKALHPDDGWVERDKGKIRLQYPFWRIRPIEVGDLIAVTNYQSFELLKVTRTTDDRDVFFFEAKKPETLFAALRSIFIGG
jgi:hypothetical protein